MDTLRVKGLIAFIEEHPEAWDQNYWMEAVIPKTVKEKRTPWTCGTQACLAGWATHFAGFKPVINKEEGKNERGQYDVAVVTLPDGKQEYIRQAAADYLGLDDDQQEWLFHHTRDLNDFRDFVDFDGDLERMYAAQ